MSHENCDHSSEFPQFGPSHALRALATWVSLMSEIPGRLSHCSYVCIYIPYVDIQRFHPSQLKSGHQPPSRWHLQWGLVPPEKVHPRSSTQRIAWWPHASLAVTWVSTHMQSYATISRIYPPANKNKPHIDFHPFQNLVSEVLSLCFKKI